MISGQLAGDFHHIKKLLSHVQITPMLWCSQSTYLANEWAYSCLITISYYLLFFVQAADRLGTVFSCLWFLFDRIKLFLQVEVTCISHKLSLWRHWASHNLSTPCRQLPPCWELRRAVKGNLHWPDIRSEPGRERVWYFQPLLSFGFHSSPVGGNANLLW